MRGLLIASRPLYLPGGLLLYVVGIALAQGRRDPRAIALGAVVVALVHVITHYVNDAEDVATDDRTAAPTAFTGGSRAIQRGLVTPAALMRASLVLAVIVAAVAAVEAALGDAVGASLHVAILVLGYAYSGQPFAFGRRGLGEIVTALIMGVLVPISGAHAAGGVSPAVATVVPLLFVETVLARLCTAYPDLDADRDTGKRTIPVLLGPRGSALAFGAAAAAVALAGLAAAPQLPAPGWQRASAAGVALAAGTVAVMIASGRVRRAPIVVPLVGLGAYGASLFVLLFACFMSR